MVIKYVTGVELYRGEKGHKKLRRRRQKGGMGGVSYNENCPFYYTLYYFPLFVYLIRSPNLNGWTDFSKILIKHVFWALITIKNKKIKLYYL